MRTYWHNSALRTAGAVDEGWRTFDQIYVPAERDRDRLEAVQAERLTRLLHAAADAPRFAGLGLRQATCATARAQHDRLPIMDKTVVADDPGSLRTGRVAPEDVLRTRTSGSTGTPLTIEHSQSRLSEGLASELRSFAAYGIDPGARSLRTTADMRLPLIDITSTPLQGAMTTVQVNVARLDTTTVDYTNRLLVDFAPDVLWGQPMELLLTCLRTADMGLRLPESIRLVRTHGDTLDDGTRQALKLTLPGARHCDVYGLQEFGKVAWQCPDQPTNYHLEEEKLLVEVVAGRLRVTSLVNEAMTFIRYQPDDAVDSPPTTCPCGRSSLVLTGLRGRQRGFIVDQAGVFHAVKPVRLYLESLPLRRWTFRQDDAGQAHVRLVAQPGVSVDLDAVRTAVARMAHLHTVTVQACALADLLTPAGKAPQFSLLATQESVSAQVERLRVRS